MSNITELKTPTNKDAIKVLEEAIELVKKGEITQLGVAWVRSDGGGGSIKNIYQRTNDQRCHCINNNAEYSFHLNGEYSGVQ